MKSITENEAYLLGILFGKGSIDPIDDDVILKFRTKFRRPNDKSIRADNVHTKNNNREYIESLKSKLTNDFSSIIRILRETWKINSTIDLPNSYSNNDWSMKEITITTEKISKDFPRLKELLDTHELSNNSLKRFPFHLKMEESKPISLAFIQGICDSCSLITNEASSSYGGDGECRIQLEPSQERWEIPLGLCELFQIGLNIPVHNINWGHPQIRGKKSWKYQNHQFRVSLKHIPQEIELYRIDYRREEYKNLYTRRGITYEKGELCPRSRKIHKGDKIKLQASDDELLVNELLDERIRGIDINVKGRKSICICKLLGCRQCAYYFDIDIDGKCR